MKRWEDILKEEPSKDLKAATESRVFAELAGVNAGRRRWLQFASVSLGLAAMFGAYKIVPKNKEENLAAAGMEATGSEASEQALLELADEGDLNLENLEDLDVIEILEEIEQWQSG